MKLSVAQVKWAASKFATMNNAEIADALDNIVSEDQIRSIRRGRSWAHVTGIGKERKPNALKPKRKANVKSSTKGHPLYELTTEINTQIGLRLRNLIRSRKISNRLIAAALSVTESSVHSKIYRHDNYFSLAQILIVREALFPDVSILWIITGKYNGDEKPEYVSRAEFYEIDRLIERLKREAKKIERG